MRKFVSDLLEVGKDIAYGAFYIFKVIVLFFWWVGVVTDEHSTKFVKYIKAKFKKPVQVTDIEIIDFNTKKPSAATESIGIIP
ncbi:MAG: hypothetical protein Q4D26_07560 [Clostridia bacterium]|nr:hypothetical protein [Clostridia bacterium]